MESPENESTHPSKDTVADDNGNYSYNNKLLLKRVAQSKSSLCLNEESVDGIKFILILGLAK